MFDISFLIPDYADPVDYPPYYDYDYDPPPPEEEISCAEDDCWFEELCQRADSGAFDLENECLF